LLSLARKLIPAPARVAPTAVTAVPTDTHALARRPSNHVRADGIDGAGHFMPRNARVLNPGPMALLHQRIAVTNAASRHLDPDNSRRRLGYWFFDNLKLSFRR